MATTVGVAIDFSNGASFGYPFLPLVYIVIAAAVCISLLITKFSTCGWGVLIMLTGIPIYYATKPKE